MPGIDQTGPMGQGPMTGRRMGRCTNYGANQRKEAATPASEKDENQVNDFPGRGFGFGWRRGRGRGRGMGRQNRFMGGF